jgi:nitrite reductase/ring-hydroxylating ferredoxin subunit
MISSSWATKHSVNRMSQELNRKRFLELGATLVTGAALGALSRPAATAAQTLRVPAPQQAWDMVEFTYVDAQRSFPGIAVRLPNATGAGLIAVCSICPHMGCLFKYETDYEDVGNMIGMKLTHPVFFCACHSSTYDPLRNGEVISGPSQRRPWRVSVQEEPPDMVLTGIEPGAGEIR